MLLETIKYVRQMVGTSIARLAVRTCRQVPLEKVAFAHYAYPKIKNVYGDFRLDENYSTMHISGLEKESGNIRGVIVLTIRKTAHDVTHVLLPGEYNRDKKFYAELFEIDESNITTAGVGSDMDYEWDYENDPPEMGTFDYIVSQAMLEHLLNPYKHVQDSARMLKDGGYMILHTHIPGFPYHRHPIDCVRFFPDWFEKTAERLGLEVYDRYIGDLCISYTFRKPI